MRRTLGVMFLAWGAACTCQKEMPDGKDVTAPTWPPDAVITLTDVTETGATASWPDASDDVGVTGYIVEKEGQRVAETTTPTFALTGHDALQYRRHWATRLGHEARHGRLCLRLGRQR